VKVFTINFELKPGQHKKFYFKNAFVSPSVSNNTKGFTSKTSLCCQVPAATQTNAIRTDKSSSKIKVAVK
jgi:hypothetical protein